LLAAQVYAANRSSSNPKDRWLAFSVDTLLHQYPGLRVAFVENKAQPTGKVEYTVLIKARIGVPTTDPNATEEMYR
jgi:hypothetical protein